MATKKKKKAAKKTKRKVKAVKKTKKRLTRASGRKINLVVKNLALFVILTVASYLIQSVATNKFLHNLFYLLAIILGFISLAFLIVLLILLVMKGLKK